MPIDPQPVPNLPLTRVIGVAGSAGGLEALREIVSSLPAGFSSPVLVLLHLAPHQRSLLPELLSRIAHLKVVQASDGVILERNTIYVAVPDRHLEVDLDGRVRLLETAPIHYSRPAADRLFETLARAFGAGATGVICSGSGLDGAAGLEAIRAAGGITIAQSPATCAYPSMPAEAIRTGAAVEVLPLSEIGPRLQQISSGGIDGQHPTREAL